MLPLKQLKNTPPWLDHPRGRGLTPSWAWPASGSRCSLSESTGPGVPLAEPGFAPLKRTGFSVFWGQSIRSDQWPQVLGRGALWALASAGPVPCPLPQGGPQPRPALSGVGGGSPSATGWPRGHTRRPSWCCHPPGRVPRAGRRSVETTGTWGGRARRSRSRRLRTHARPHHRGGPLTLLPCHVGGGAPLSPTPAQGGGQGPQEPHPWVLRGGYEASGGLGLSGRPGPLPPSCWPLGPVPRAPTRPWAWSVSWDP